MGPDLEFIHFEVARILMGYRQAGIPMNRAPEVRLEVSPWRASRERGEAVG